jgi:hypothetical protein
MVQCGSWAAPTRHCCVRLPLEPVSGLLAQAHHGVSPGLLLRPADIQSDRAEAFSCHQVLVPEHRQSVQGQPQPSCPTLRA